LAYQDIDQLLNEVWGWPQEGGTLAAYAALVSNVAIGSNPPYSAANFLAFHPQYLGNATIVSGTLDGSTGVITNLSSVTGLAAGQIVAGPGIPQGSAIQSLTPPPIQVTATTVSGNANIVVSSSAGIEIGNPVSGAGIQAGATVLEIQGTTLTLSSTATANGTNVPLQIGVAPSMTISNPTTVAGSGVSISVYTAPLVPSLVLNAYVNLASRCIQSVRWCELWPLGMGLFIEHNCILYLRALAQGPGSTAAQVVQAGLAIGIQTSKAAGNVSVGMAILEGISDWGAYQLTLPGQQFATFAKAIGSGGMLLL
jgi:hypothetical protein